MRAEKQRPRCPVLLLLELLLLLGGAAVAQSQGRAAAGVGGGEAEGKGEGEDDFVWESTVCGGLSLPGPVADSVAYIGTARIPSPRIDTPRSTSHRRGGKEEGPGERRPASVVVGATTTRTIAADVYFPRSTALDPLPVVSFAHGLLSPDFEYTSYLKHLAGHGFLAIAVSAEMGLFPSQDQFAADLRAAIDWAAAQNASSSPASSTGSQNSAAEASSSVLAGRVDASRAATMGHSAGAAAAVWAAHYPLKPDPRIRTVVSLAGGVGPGANATAWVRTLKVPLLIVSGSADFLAWPQYSRNLYRDAAPEVPRVLAEIHGGWHCGFMDESIELPDPLCRPLTGWMSRWQQLQVTRCLYTPWLVAHLRGDQAAAQRAWTDVDPHLVNATFDPGFPSLQPATQTVRVISSSTSNSNSCSVVEARAVLSLPAARSADDRRQFFVSEATCAATLDVVVGVDTARTTAVKLTAQLPPVPRGLVSATHRVAVSVAEADTGALRSAEVLFVREGARKP